MIDATSEPRCPTCDTMLVHSGAICVICDDEVHYEAPIRTAPPLKLPEEEDGGDTVSQAHRIRRLRVS